MNRELKVSIITYPQANLKVEEEIRLMKIALLYSDKITIASPSITAVAFFVQLSMLSEKQKIEMLGQIVPIIQKDFDVEGFEHLKLVIKNLRNKKGKKHEEIVLLGRYQNMVRNMHEHYLKLANERYQDSNFQVLEPFIRSGQLELVPLDMGSKDKTAEKMLELIVNTLYENGTYPLFDDKIEDLASAYIKEKMPLINYSNTKEIEFAKEILLKLPNVDSITFEQISELKCELEKQLLTFKQVIFDYSKEISSIPYTNETKREIDKKYEYKIKPEIIAIREEIAKNKFYKVLLKNLMPDKLDIAIFVSLASLVKLETLYSGIGAAIPIGYRSYMEHIKQKEIIANSKLFFYHKLTTIK